jgi:hypothetical protein
LRNHGTPTSTAREAPAFGRPWARRRIGP